MYLQYEEWMGKVKTVRRLNKKFRFQLLQDWLTARYKPCKVLDVGGGKGLLSLLLRELGWQATVIDPVKDIYLHKNKDNKDFLLLPCCVIDEPIVKVADVNWLESLIEYAKNLNFEVKTDTLNFKGQNKLIYRDNHLKKRLI